MLMLDIPDHRLMVCQNTLVQAAIGIYLDGDLGWRDRNSPEITCPSSHET